MNWKPKQNLLNLEENIEAAKRERSPFWFGSEPLLIGIESEGKPSIYPISPKLTSRDQVLLFIDPTSFSSERAPDYLREWRHRYHKHQLDTILFICPPYKTFQKPERIQDLVKKYSNSFILALDSENLIAQSFSVTQFPKAILLSKGKILFEMNSEENLPLFEIKIQNYLRKTDPGLPLLPKFQISTRRKEETRRIELSDSKLYPSPGFAPHSGDIEVGRFPNTTHAESSSRMMISGNWVKQGERLITSDPNATLSLSIKSIESFFSVIAHSASLEGKTAEISIEVNDLPPTEEVLAKDLQPLDDGRVIAFIREARIYHLLSHLPLENQKVTLRFPSANDCPIELFGLRLGRES